METERARYKKAFVKSLNLTPINYKISNPDHVDNIWKYLKSGILSTTEKICGW